MNRKEENNVKGGTSTIEKSLATLDLYVRCNSPTHY